MFTPPGQAGDAPRQRQRGDSEALRGVRGARLGVATYQEAPLTRCTYTPRGAPQAQGHGV